MPGSRPFESSFFEVNPGGRVGCHTTAGFLSVVMNVRVGAADVEGAGSGIIGPRVAETSMLLMVGTGNGWRVVLLQYSGVLMASYGGV